MRCSAWWQKEGGVPSLHLLALRASASASLSSCSSSFSQPVLLLRVPVECELASLRVCYRPPIALLWAIAERGEWRCLLGAG